MRDPDRQVSASWVLRTWHRVPILIRSLLSGLFVFMTLQVGCNILLVANFQVTPAIPWHVPAGLLYLWVAFRYFGGRWSPAATSPSRREALRARRLSVTEWRLASVACAAVSVFIISFAMLNYRLIAIPEEATDLSIYPWWTIYPTLIMISMVAGVSEEAGFRGYMQAPLEKRYGAGVAIALTATAFWVIHFNHPSGITRGPSLLAMGIALGALAYASRSIIPPLITHAFADSMVFVGAQSEVGPEWLWSPPLLSESGFDGAMTGTVVVAGVSGAMAIIALRHLRRTTSSTA